MKFTLILLLCLITVTGCKTKTADAVPETFSTTSEKGLAIGTITFEGEKPVNDIYRFFYEPTSGDKKFMRQNDGKIEIKARVNNEPAYNGDFDNKKTYLFVIECEPGNYAFTQYNYLDHIGYTGTVSNSKKFAIPFDIKKGEITYIGELTYIENAQPGSPRIVIWDKFDRDKKEFKKKYPAINWDAAHNNTVKKGDTGEGIIDFMEQ
ncbi:hypothetical protein E0W68_03215 [Flavobacterium salilacus subsp. salilacus]|uniref:hypothetical protein n=1 Tax=Flavobacterium TaxID=237 RepID=UPI0010758BD3|nr:MULTISPECIES: hypothetical protein [Flavobacterium]KAF2519370.1 hypothetical protein E0W68_03215 [Flavobacterium salilacus subsp. salilacus]MBE1614738.1 hypothetical protein [Flavobacterium sp. SaA2.13]